MTNMLATLAAVCVTNWAGLDISQVKETGFYTWETNRLGSNAVVERVCYKVLEFKWDGEPFRVEKRTVIERWIRTWKSGEGWKDER